MERFHLALDQDSACGWFCNGVVLAFPKSRTTPPHTRWPQWYHRLSCQVPLFWSFPPIRSIRHRDHLLQVSDPEPHKEDYFGK